MVVVGDMQARMMPEGIVQMHGAAAHHRKHIGDAVGAQEIGYIIGQTLFHGIPPRF